MRSFTGTDFDDVYKKLCEALLLAPESVRRGMKTKELRNVTFSIIKPERCVLSSPARNLSLKYLKAELKWYMSGSLDASDISQHVKMWDAIKDEDGKVQSNYGHFVYYPQTPKMASQYSWCVRELEQDEWTRHAVINYNQPRHKKPGTKDFVCTMYQAFMKDVETGALDTMISMRSSDVIYGLSYDVPWFSYVHQNLCKDLNMPAGKLYYHGLNLHCYEKHYEKLRKIAMEPPYMSKTLMEV